MISSSKPLLLITGATATGKTEIAIDLALELAAIGLKAEIVNSDSLLFYKELNIGTAKPSLNDLKTIPHHLINVRSAENPMNVNDYVFAAEEIIENLFSEGKIPIVTGGSAFYVRGLIKGLYDGTASSSEAIEKVKKLEEQKGWIEVRDNLKKYDPESFEALHENDHYRNKRALEYFFTTGKKFSTLKEEKEGPYDFSKPAHSHWKIHHTYLQLPKELHWEIMKKRAQSMLKNGLLLEVEGLLKAGLSKDLKPLQSIGYKETIEFLEAKTNKPTDIVSLEERIFINTRRLAKSQKTFFNKIEPKIIYNSVTDKEKIIKDCIEFLQNFEGFA